MTKNTNFASTGLIRLKIGLNVNPIRWKFINVNTIYFEKVDKPEEGGRSMWIRLFIKFLHYLIHI